MSNNAKRSRGTGRTNGNGFAGIPRNVMRSQHYVNLTTEAKVLLFEFALQYNGYNNGNLAGTRKQMLARGWTSHDTLHNKLLELQYRGFIVETQKGARPNVPSLYALTWERIDQIRSKPEISPTTRSLDFWKSGKNPRFAPTKKQKEYLDKLDAGLARKPGQCGPTDGLMNPEKARRVGQVDGPSCGSAGPWAGHLSTYHGRS